MRRWIWIGGFVAACGGSGGGTPDATHGPDAAHAPDAAGTPDAIGFVDSMAPPACNALAPGGTHVWFLDFAGDTLAQGANDDASMDVAAFIGVATATIPAWHGNTTSIDAIACQVRQALDAFDIDVVTTRPATGAYETIVIGGTAADVGYPDGLAGGATGDCGDTNHANVGWVADSASGVTTPDTQIANYALGAIGVDIGLDGVGTTGDCMCGWGDPNGCAQSTTDLCVFHDGMTDTALSCSTGQENERVALTAAYGTRT